MIIIKDIESKKFTGILKLNRKRYAKKIVSIVMIMSKNIKKSIRLKLVGCKNCSFNIIF